MNVSVFGLGYVGCVSLGCLAQNGHHVVGVDVSQSKVDQINAGLATIVEPEIDSIIREQRQRGTVVATTDAMDAVLVTDVSIIAVGTPSSEKGHLDLGHVIGVAEGIGAALRHKDGFHVIAIRSTILPGTCDRFAEVVEKRSGKARNVGFAMVANPEFLREGTAVRDYYHPPLTLIGSDNAEASRMVASLYMTLPGEVVHTALRVAEIMKYVNNTFHALKICFANEVGNICTALGIDSHEVMGILCKDRQLNISPYYLKPGFAYGGSCLPKDLKGFQTLAHDLYIDVPLIDSIDDSNGVQLRRAIGLIERQGKRKVGFLGISFKAGTDDLRNSPAVSVIEALIGKGYEVCIYDKNVQTSRLQGTNRDYIDAKIPHLCRLMVGDVFQLVERCELIVISNREDEFASVLKGASGKVVLDMVRLSEDMRSTAGYIGINW